MVEEKTENLNGTDYKSGYSGRHDGLSLPFLVPVPGTAWLERTH